MAQVIALLAAAPTAEWRGLILIAAFTGLRMTDAARLRWDTVDLDQGLITLIPRKTKRKKREVRIPIQADLLLFLKEQAKVVVEGEPNVLPALAKKKPMDGMDCRKRLWNSWPRPRLIAERRHVRWWSMKKGAPEEQFMNWASTLCDILSRVGCEPLVLRRRIRSL